MSADTEIRYYEGATSIVTGAASGIGRALAGALAEAGSHVLLVDLQDDLLGDAEKSIARPGVDTWTRRVDVCDAEAVADAVGDAFARHRRLDFLFNNAGIVVQGEVQEHTLEDWNRIIDINLRGVVHGVQAAYPRMLEQGFGHVVNTASFAGLVPTPMLAGYTATKHAVVALTHVLRSEGAPRGIRASAICPGRVRTPIMTGGRFGRVIPPISQRVREARAERGPLMDPDELARRVLRRLPRNPAAIVEPRAVARIEALRRHCPRLFDRLSARAFVRMQRDVAAAVEDSRTGTEASAGRPSGISRC